MSKDNKKWRKPVHTHNTEHKEAIPQAIRPIAPKLNTLPRIHKEKIPIRPLVNYTIAPAYKLVKYMDHVIRANIKFQNQDRKSVV